jgi:hypothetical protein
MGGGLAALITYGKAIHTLLWLARKLVEAGEKHGWIEEGKRQYIQAELEAVNRALIHKDKLRKKIEKMTDAELAALIDSYRKP